MRLCNFSSLTTLCHHFGHPVFQLHTAAGSTLVDWTVVLSLLPFHLSLFSYSFFLSPASPLPWASSSMKPSLIIPSYTQQATCFSCSVVG